MKTKYALQGMKENMAKAITKDLGISTKISIEISNFIRGKTTKEAKQILERVLKKKQAIPFKRFTDGVGHRKGANIAAGRYPQKATEAFLTIIKQCEANAQAKGLSEDLRIIHLAAQKGTNAFRAGRQRRRKYKRTHLEIALEEIETKKEKITTKKETKPTIKDEIKETIKDEQKQPNKKQEIKETTKKESKKENPTKKEITKQNTTKTEEEKK